MDAPAQLGVDALEYLLGHPQPGGHARGLLLDARPRARAVRHHRRRRQVAVAEVLPEGAVDQVQHEGRRVCDGPQCIDSETVDDMAAEALILVVLGAVDNLRRINDQYGHLEGDYAPAQAEAGAAVRSMPAAA